VTVSPPIRVAALVGALVAAGLVAFVFVMGRGVSESATSTPAKPATELAQRGAATPTGVTPTKAIRPRAAAPRVVVTKSGFPAPVDRALRRRGVAVVAVYMPRAAVDALVRTEARAAAIESRVGYVAISALSERLVSLLVAETGVLPAPSVLVIKRPGIVTATLGVADRETIAQAVAQARR